MGKKHKANRYSRKEKFARAMGLTLDIEEERKLAQEMPWPPQVSTVERERIRFLGKVRYEVENLGHYIKLNKKFMGKKIPEEHKDVLRALENFKEKRTIENLGLVYDSIYHVRMLAEQRLDYIEKMEKKKKTPYYNEAEKKIKQIESVLKGVTKVVWKKIINSPEYRSLLTKNKDILTEKVLGNLSLTLTHDMNEFIKEKMIRKDRRELNGICGVNGKGEIRLVSSMTKMFHKLASPNVFGKLVTYIEPTEASVGFHAHTKVINESLISRKDRERRWELVIERTRKGLRATFLVNGKEYPVNIRIEG